MKNLRQSPALVVSIIAVVIACAGTATAATVLIKNSSQIRAGAVNGSDIANKSVKGGDLADDTITASKLRASLRNTLTNQGFTATEASRRSGPTDISPGSHVIATLSQLAPGTYALFAKTVVRPSTGEAGLLLELLRQSRTVNADCVLKAGGDEDRARQAIASPYSVAPATINFQMTRTLDSPTDVTVSCNVNDYKWTAADTSIIALKLAGSSRSDVQQ